MKTDNLIIVLRSSLDPWYSENGFTHYGKQTDIFGHYYRIDPLDNRVAQMIRYHYDDSNDCYYVKWQMWTGTGNKKRLKMYPTPKRKDKVEWECETDNEKFWDHLDSGYIKMIEYIKKHSEEKFELLRNYMKKKGYKV